MSPPPKLPDNEEDVQKSQNVWLSSSSPSSQQLLKPKDKEQLQPQKPPFNYWKFGIAVVCILILLGLLIFGVFTYKKKQQT